MNLKTISDIGKTITKTKTKYFVKGKFKGKTFYINITGRMTSKPVYFDFYEEAKEHLEKFVYGFGSWEFRKFKPNVLMKHVKIYDRTEPEIFWKRYGTSEPKTDFKLDFAIKREL